MDNYIVSARKYRPMTFDTVVGQEALTTTLKNSIASGRLAHAYLFCGPRGVGKTTCARIFAKTINCLSPGANGEACGECESCRSFNEQRSLNIYELDAASNNSIEDIRQLIEQTRIPPQVGKYKVFIVDEVHMLSTAAFNAFLKTLEEPPHYVIFILATTEKHKLLPTILSRCQIYDFNRMNVPEIVRHLQMVAQKEGIQTEDSALQVIAEKADGGMRDALSIFDQVAAFCEGNITYQKTIANLNVLDYEYYFKLVDYFLGNDIPKIMTTFNEILNKGFLGDHFINGLNSHLRNLLMSKDPQTLPLIEANEDVRQRYGQQAQKCKQQFIYAAIRRCTDCDLNYKQSQNKRLLVEITLIEIAQAAQDDVPSAGRSPKKILKPIFAATEKSQTSAAASAVAQPKAVNVANVGQTKQPANAQPTANPAFNAASVQLPNVENAPKRGRMFSISGATSNQTRQTTEDKTVVAIPESSEKMEFDVVNLTRAVKTYASKLPMEEMAFSTGLSSMKFNITGDKQFEAVAENQIVLAQVQKNIPQITDFVCRFMGIDGIVMTVRLAEKKEHAKILSPYEQYNEMKKINESLTKLEEEFALTF